MKIMLDECVTEGPAETIIQYLALENPPIPAVFLLTYFGQQGLKDQPWAKVLADEGGWYVITSDRDKARKSQKKRLADGPPLPKILPAYRLTAVYMSGSIQNAPSPEKARAVISTWPAIKKFFQTAPLGARALLHKQGSGFGLRED